MPSPRAFVGAIALLAALALVTAVPIASALDTSTKAIRVVGTSGEETVQSFASQTTGGPNAYDGSRVGIAVLDTGVDNEHPTFAPGAFVAGAQVQNPCFGEDCIQDENPNGAGCYDPDDSDGHGTHVASIALGQGGSGNARGVAPGASLIDVKIASSVGGISLNGITEGIDWVIRYNNGEAACEPDVPVDIISLSFGTTSPHDSKAYDDAMRAVQRATDEGILVVAAAGNCGPGGSGMNFSCPGDNDDEDTIVSPGAAQEALTVGAVDHRASAQRGQDHVAPFSSRGPNPGDHASDPRRKPDVVAPGANITAACYAQFGSASNNGNGCTKSGTSMSTPHVSGLAAILIQALDAHNEGPITPERIKTLITSTAEPMGPDAWDKDAGYGYIHGYKALVEAVNQPPISEFSYFPLEPTAGETITFDGSATTDPNDDPITEYIWTFPDEDDPVTTPVPRIDRVYDEPGTYEVTLTAVDEHGTHDPHPFQETITVAEPEPEEDPKPPTARLSLDPEEPRATEPTTLSAESSSGNIDTYRWDLDHDEDQGFSEDHATNDATLTVTFDEPGPRTLAVRVADQNGLTDTTTLDVLIQPPPPGPPSITLSNPQEGDEIEPGTFLASWTVQGTVDRFTVYLDGVEDANTTEHQLRMDIPEGEHTLRVHASGPGGQHTAWANFTAVDQAPGDDDANDTHDAPEAEDEDLAQLSEDDPDETPLPAWSLVLALLLAALHRTRPDDDPP